MPAVLRAARVAKPASIDPIRKDGCRPRHTPHLFAAKDPLAAHTPAAVSGQPTPRSARTAPYQPCLVCTHCLRYAYTNLISTTQRHCQSNLLAREPTDQTSLAPVATRRNTCAGSLAPIAFPVLGCCRCPSARLVPCILPATQPQQYSTVKYSTVKYSKIQ